MKNMSKTNKEKLLRMDLQTFVVEINLTKMADLGEIKSIDSVNRFEAGIKELPALLGVTRLELLSQDLKIQTYKWETDVKGRSVAGGEDIPLSKVTRAKDKDHTVTFNKQCRAVSAEAVACREAPLATDKADNRLLRQTQRNLKSKFVTSLDISPTKVTSVGLQKALATSWGKLSIFEEFDGVDFVSFVNPMGVAAYLGGTKVLADASNVFEMALLKNFSGASNVVVLNVISGGKIYFTAAGNTVLAYLDVKASDLGDIFIDFVDETGFISITRGRTLQNATYESLFMNALVLFTEIPKGVVEATIKQESPK